MPPRLSPTPLITADRIERRIREMAAEIRRDHQGPLHVVGVLKGAFVFLADLIRHLDGDVSVDFLAVSSYASGTTSSGDVRLRQDLEVELHGRHVLIVEDIVDTGVTLARLQQMLRARGPQSVQTACLLDKPSRRTTEVAVEYVGFAIEDRFVVGYGLDVDEHYRNLPHVFTLEQDRPLS